MDTEVSMRSASCPYTVECYGVLFKEVSLSPLCSLNGYCPYYMFCSKMWACLHCVQWTATVPTICSVQRGESVSIVFSERLLSLLHVLFKDVSLSPLCSLNGYCPYYMFCSKMWVCLVFSKQLVSLLYVQFRDVSVSLFSKRLLSLLHVLFRDAQSLLHYVQCWTQRCTVLV